MDEQFARDVKKGLTSKEKFLYSKYFYDEAGDRLFQQITKLPEYYLTAAEQEIIEKNTGKLLEYFNEGTGSFNLVEFGTGDGEKTRIMLRYFAGKSNFSYCPIDISENALNILQAKIKADIPGINIEPVNGEYFEAMDILNKKSFARKVIMFMGANIGNFLPPMAIDFLNNVAKRMQKNDLFLMGVDLKKDPMTILNAYNDSKGVTADFNYNLLLRINTELGGDFDIKQFYHYPFYDPSTGECKSFLISKIKQIVHIEKFKLSINFEAGEPIYMEVSQKYSIDEIQDMILKAGLKVVEMFLDENKYFVDVLVKKEG